MNNNVSVGWASIVGYLLTLVSAIATGIAAHEGELSGNGKWLAILTIVIGALTNLQRTSQAKEVIKQSAATPAPTDAKDGPWVAQAEEPKP